MQPDQRFSPPRGVNCRVRPLLRRVVRDILLPRTLEETILASNSGNPGNFGLISFETSNRTTCEEVLPCYPAAL